MERRSDTDSIAVSLVEIKQCYLCLSIRLQDPKITLIIMHILHCGVDESTMHVVESSTKLEVVFREMEGELFLSSQFYIYCN